MPSLGTQLRQERDRRGLRLADISAQTRIRESYLEAIENDRLDLIPGGFFARSFTRQYAALLGFDLQRVERELEAITANPLDTVRVDKVFTDYRPANGPVLGMAPEGEESEFSTDSSYLKDPKTGMPWIALAVLLIVACVGFLTWQRRPELFSFHRAKSAAPAATAARPAESWEKAPAAASAAVTAHRDPALDLTAAEAASPSPQPGGVNGAPSGPAGGSLPASQGGAVERAPLPGSVTFEVTANAPAWVEVRADGRRVFSGILQAGETRQWSAAERASVWTGNAGALAVALNGRSVGEIGPPGVVRTVLMSAAGAEIRAAAQKSGSSVVPPSAASASPNR